jgi:hypothetical protein
MFERLKFMAEYVGAYRRSRKAGTAHGAALEAAAQDVLDRKLGRRDEVSPADVTLAESVVELWIDPDTACGLADGAWFGDGSFEITPSHLSMLRQMRFAWDGAERGAPMLDPKRPYGRRDLLAQLGEVFGTDDADELARRHVDMLFVLARVLKHGSLAPGHYALRNIGASDVREAMRGYGGDDGVTDADLGLDADGQVAIGDDHLRLLRAIEIRWPSDDECEERLSVGEFPAAAAEPKRPYGDFTFIEVDMARILGVLPPRTDGDSRVFEPSPDLAGRLQRLHWQMLVAMQVFAEQANPRPGVFGLDT